MNNAAIYTVLPQARHHAPISHSTREKCWDGRQNGLTSNISQTLDSSLSAKEHNQVVEMLEEMSIPVAFDCFEGMMPKAPFILFSTLGQDGLSGRKKGIIVSLYQTEYQEELELRLQRVIQRKKLYDIEKICRRQGADIHQTDYLIACQNEFHGENPFFKEVSAWS